MKVKCPKCHKKITPHPRYGVVWCADCTRDLGHINKPTSSERVDDKTREDRLRYKDDIVQPYRDDIPSQEFIDANPNTTMFTDKQRKKADYVWRDVDGHKRKHGKKFKIRV